jgi:hypothetical protein
VVNERLFLELQDAADTMQVLDELLFWGLQAPEDEKMLNELLFFGATGLCR